MKKSSAFSLIEMSIVLLIIGLIIAGATGASRLIRMAKVASADNLTSSSPVASIKGLGSWLEPSKKGAIINAQAEEPDDDEKVAAWNDENPTVPLSDKINLSQTEVNNQPLYITKGINGIPSIKFNDQQVLTPSPQGNQNMLSQYSNFVIIMVFRTNLTSAAQTIFEQYKADSSFGKKISISLNNENSSDTTSQTLQITVTGDLPITVPYCCNNNENHIIAIASNNDVVTSYVNSLQNFGQIGDMNNGYMTSTSENGVYFGNNKDGAAPFKGLVSELIVFDRILKTSELNETIKYLAEKYAIKLAS